ncbi:MAG: hypothetical protein KF718_06490 [Polyangiaceae bacterium]|nr:hypothetical protein [Polyangiaceae bacterium]
MGVRAWSAVSLALVLGCGGDDFSTAPGAGGAAGSAMGGSGGPDGGASGGAGGTGGVATGGTGASAGSAGTGALAGAGGAAGASGGAAGAGGIATGGTGGVATGGTGGVATGGTGGVATGGTGGVATGGTGGVATGGTGGVATGGTGGTCTGGCITVPTDWSGPVVVAPTCSGTYPTTVQNANQGLTAPGACSCQCGGPSCSAQVGLDPGASCGTVLTQLTVGATCQAVNGQNIGSLEVTPVGACGSISSTTLPPPQWSVQHKLCEAPSPSGCPSGQKCAPPKPPPRCVWRAGQHSCPGGYSKSSTYFTGFTDTRQCTPCACSPKCNVEVQAFSAAQCSSTSLSCTAFGANTCCNTGSEVFVTGLRMVSANVEHTGCTGGEMTGFAVPTGAYTVCCEE